MTVLCVTFSTSDHSNAVSVAAQLARRTGQPLVISRVLPTLQGPQSEERATRARLELAREREAARAAGSFDVQTHLLFGPIEEAIGRDARQLEARLVVIGASEVVSSSLYSMLLERLCEQLPMPLLFARGAQAFDAWREPERPLRVLLLVEHTASSSAAMTWLSQLATYGRVDVRAACAPPLAAALRGTAPERLEPSLKAQLLASPQPRTLHFSLLPPEVLSPAAIQRLALEQQIELIVTGREPAQQGTWGTSTLHELLADGTTAVAIVPPGAPG